MADVAARKRARSPSPSYADALASPLEVLLKRRRRDVNGGRARMPPPPVWRAPSLGGPSAGYGGGASSAGPNMATHMDEEAYSSSHEQSSPLRGGGGGGYFGGVERRRQRQWERLQAPQALSQPPPAPPTSSPTPAIFRNSASQPPLRRSVTNESMASIQSSDEEVARGNGGAFLSSSPVRHQPPGSTPFKPNDWTPEERVREWGAEYASQNSLLHSLHLARHESQQAHVTQPSPMGTPFTNRTMDMSSPANHHFTPAQPMSSHDHHNHHFTPAQAYSNPHTHGMHLTPSDAANAHLPTPYRHARSHETPGLGVSSPWASSPAQTSPYPSYPSAPNASPVNLGQTEHIHASYEEANRLLSELNMQRMRRYGSGRWDDEGM